jgi:hypothetical protein
LTLLVLFFPPWVDFSRKRRKLMGALVEGAKWRYHNNSSSSNSQNWSLSQQIFVIDFCYRFLLQIFVTDFCYRFLLQIFVTDFCSRLLFQIVVPDCCYRLLLQIVVADCCYILLLQIVVTDCCFRFQSFRILFRVDFELCFLCYFMHNKAFSMSLIQYICTMDSKAS